MSEVINIEHTNQAPCTTCKENAEDLLRVAVKASELIGSDTKWCTGEEAVWDQDMQTWKFCAIGAVKQVSDIFIFWVSEYQKRELGWYKERESWNLESLSRESAVARHLIDMMSVKSRKRRFPIGIVGLNDEGDKKQVLEVFAECIEELEELVVAQKKAEPIVKIPITA